MSITPAPSSDSSCAIGCGVFVFVAVVAAGVRLELPDWIIASVAGLIALVIICTGIIGAEQERQHRAIQISNIDSMTGVEFEHYLQRLLIAQGYSVQLTQASGDLGVDLIACKDTERVAIQAKRYASKISRRAISDAFAGMQYYRCTKCMVVTNSTFTQGAITLAYSTSCILVDRNLLAQWIMDYRNASKQNTQDVRSEDL